MEEKSRRSSSIFYSDEEDVDEEERDNDEVTEKQQEVDDTERYTTVAVRAKLSVEVEQRKRLGAWAKRVLVLDGATLYAYKTKGEGGSVGGWEVGGAEVHVRRSSDSSREDGRHLLVIARPPVYKLTFSFTTTYEQSRMIQALSSSGATVTGLDAIMLLKNLRKQQEEAQREEEQKQRQQKEQKQILSETEGKSGSTSLNNTQDVEEDEAEVEEEQQIEEDAENVEEDDSGSVSNPLDSSQTNVTQPQTRGGDNDNKAEAHDVHIYSNGTSEASIYETAVSDDPSRANQNAESQVNPLPKPPRAQFQDRRPSTTADNSEGSETQRPQSPSGRGKEQEEDLSKRQAESDLIFKGESESEDELVEATNSAYSDSEDTEGEVFYEVNPEPQESVEEGEDDERNTARKKNDSHNDDSKEGVKEVAEDGGGEDNADLITRMRLERGFIIDSNTPEGSSQNLTSPETKRRDSINTPTDSPSYSPADSPALHRNLSNKRGHDGKDSKNNIEKEEIYDNAGNGDELLSDSEEKFEQLYKELSQSNTQWNPGSDPGSDSSEEAQLFVKSENTSRNNDSREQPQDSLSSEPTGKEDDEDGKEEEDAGRDETDAPRKSASGQTAVKKVSSIIKKEKRTSDSREGSLKRVQFNLDVDTIDPISSQDGKLAGKPNSPVKKSQDAETHKKKNDGKLKDSSVVTSKNKKQEPSGSPKRKSQTSVVTPPSPPTKKVTPASPTKKKAGEQPNSASPTKKKGIFSSIFSTSQGKKSETQPAKDDPSTTRLSTTAAQTSTSSAGKKEISDTPSSALKRQTTVNLNAPLIISGQVEMGGSVGGRLSGRRMEVRDAHLLAFPPRSTTAHTSKLKLTELSVMPVMGAGGSNTLVLSRAARVMMVMKLGSREEMMRWINVLSDEVIKATPEDQKMGLTLYPSSKKEEEKKEDEEEIEKEKENKKEIEKEKEKKKEIEKEKEEEEATEKEEEEATEKEGQELSDGKGEVPQITRTNGYTEVNTVVPAGSNAEKGTPSSSRQEHKHFNEEATQDDLKVTGRSSKRPAGPKRAISVDHLNEMNERQKVASHQYHKEAESDTEVGGKIGSQVQKKIQQFLRQTQEKDSHARPGPKLRRTSEEGRISHPPLRRLSGSGKLSPQPRDVGQDTVDNYLLVNNFPDSPANRHDKCKHDHKLEFNRYVSSSQSSLTSSTDSRRESSRPLQSDTISPIKHKDKPDHLGIRNEQEKKPTSETRDIRGRTSASEAVTSQSMKVAEASPASPPQSPSRPVSPHQNIVQPRKVEIIEKTDLVSVPIDVKNEQGRKNSNATNKWSKGSKNVVTAPVVQEEEELPRITWSVAATREKFELLSSLSGENKGKLTTKNPISRKRSGRGTIKQKRSFEGANVSRRASIKRSGARASLLGGDSLLNSSQELNYDTDETITSSYQDSPSPQPVRDLSRKYESDRFANQSPITDAALSKDDLSIDISRGDSNPQKEKIGPKKSPLRRTSNVLQDQSSSSSPEPDFSTSRLINAARPQGRTPEAGRMKPPSLQSSSSTSQDNDVVVCWRGRYIAQEEEQKVLANISNAFLAKRRLLAREVATARIQERLLALEERLWELQANMAQVDKSSVTSMRETREWKSLNKSHRAVEEERTYWITRLTQTQREAEEARQKLATALSTVRTPQNSTDAPDRRTMQEEGEEMNLALEDASEA